jgi:Arm DNA-binding domain
VIWDDELPGFGLRVFSSGKRSYVIQYRIRGRSRRYTIGLHGAWAPETARREVNIQGLLDGIEFKQTACALDRDSRKAAPARFLKRASGADSEEGEEERRLAA